MKTKEVWVVFRGLTGEVHFPEIICETEILADDYIIEQNSKDNFFHKIFTGPLHKKSCKMILND